MKSLRIINAHEYLADESLVKPFLFGSMMLQSCFPFRASSARFNVLYLLKVPFSTYTEASHNFIHCDWMNSINMGYVWGGTIAPEAMCESIILNSAEKENHLCGRWHLLFKPLDCLGSLLDCWVSHTVHTAYGMFPSLLTQHASCPARLYNPVIRFWSCSRGQRIL